MGVLSRSGSRNAVLDLRSRGVVAGESSQTALDENVGQIEEAIADVSGTRDRLLLPRGDIYFGQNSTNYWSIKCGTGIDRFALAGHGQNATRLIQHGAGLGGDWTFLVFDECSDITVSDLSIEQGIIQRPDESQHNHLIEFRNSSAAAQLTKRLDFFNLGFGKCLGDAFFHRYGTDYPVTDIRLLGFRMNLDGICTQDWAAETAYLLGAEVNNAGNRYRCITAGDSASSGGPSTTDADIEDGTAHWEYKSAQRRGARSGITFQGGYNRYEIGHGVIYGAANSLIDMEATSGGEREGIHFHHLDLDQSFSLSEYAVSAGSTVAAQANNLKFTDVAIREGVLALSYTDRAVLERLRITMATRVVATANLVVRNTCTKVDINDCLLERTGGTAGYCLDIQGAGNTRNVTLSGGEIVQHTATLPALVDGVDNFTIKNRPRIHYKAATGAASYAAFTIQATTADSDNFTCEGIDVVCDTGTMRAGVEAAARTPRSMTNISIKGVRGTDEYAYAVILGYGSGSTFDTQPLLNDCDAGTSAVWRFEDHNNSGIDTIHPTLAGSRGGVRTLTGTGDPDGVVAAPVGSTYLRDDGSTGTTLYTKETGAATVDGWVAK